MRVPRRGLLVSYVLAAGLLCLALALSIAETAGRPPTARRALIISIDGLRPDVLLRANAPVLRGLMSRGSYTMWAKTTAVAVTLPSHVSMLTGVPPSVHGIEWNSDIPLKTPVYSARPTLFELAKRAGFSTGMAAGKSKFSALNKSGTLDWAFVPVIGPVADDMVTDKVLARMRANPPAVLFVHLAGVDVAGHASGWGSKAQLAAVATADRCVGRLLAALGNSQDSTIVLISSDHGGAGKSHGPDDPRSRHIPWIIAGPGIRHDFDLATIAELDVRTEDTFATVCYLLGIRLPDGIVGKPVMQALLNP
jgi:predicted AlkP superfamily pyrophosphatase or phosphodiesterase